MDVLGSPGVRTFDLVARSEGKTMYLPFSASRKRLREAESARRNRQEVIRAWSQGELRRRDLLRLGLMTASGLWVLKNGLSPYAQSAYAQTTGTVPSPIPPGLEFTQPMPRLEELPRKPLGRLDPSYPAPRRESNQTKVPVMGTMGPCEGRPPGPLWAHQRWEQFYPRVCVETSQKPVAPGQFFHPAIPEIHADRFWTFEGTVPFKLVKARYGEPMLFRHHNRLSTNLADNGGFGRHTITTHFHNGHTPAESDGFAAPSSTLASTTTTGGRTRSPARTRSTRTRPTRAPAVRTTATGS